MQYISTRDKSKEYSAAQAIVQGLAPDGGLLTPAYLPKLPGHAIAELAEMSYQQRAVYVMNLFLEEYSVKELTEYAVHAYGPQKFDTELVVPVRQVDQNTYALELWHGPTCAFKDLALQMLPHLLSGALGKTEEGRDACILVATSGDTGKGALEGFRDVPRTKILVFYPKDGVAAMQELQMRTQQGDNVGVCAVEGNFDDAQTGVKKMFSDPALREQLDQRGYFFSSANSINWGRVLPQIVYYISAYCDLVKSGALVNGEALNICVPTGNFGNILAAYYAKQMGVPLGKLICASNRNNVLTDFLTTGVYDRNRPFYTTRSPSMDILISSNLERLIFSMTGSDDEQVAEYMRQLQETGRYEVGEAVKSRLQKHFAAGFCDDERTLLEIERIWKEKNYLADPHTAVAFSVLEEYRAASGDDTPTLVASTASPFKFCDSVLTALGITQQAQGTDIMDQLSHETGCPVPAPLAALKDKPIRFSQSTCKEHMADRVLEFLS